MKRILVFFILINLSVFKAAAVSSNEYDDFLKSLKLKNKQKVKIEQIEKEYNKKIVETNAQILLVSMKIAKSGNRNHPYALDDRIKVLQKEMYNLNEQKEEEILSTLNWFQRRKYREFISRAD